MHKKIKNKRVFFEPWRYSGRADIALRGKPGSKNSVERYFENYFGKPVIVTPSGRTAISFLLGSLNLKKDDEIYITTTFEKPNVSSCVTSTIFNFCKPSRVLGRKTKAIFVIHEFGVPHRKMDELIAISNKRHIPLIEDCAHTIDSEYDGTLVGTRGDYAICSIPKIFPVKSGGLLVGSDMKYKPSEIQADIIREVKTCLSKYMHELKEYSDMKRRNYRFLIRELKSSSLRPVCGINENISSSIFFPLVVHDPEKVMKRLSEENIACGLWHGSNIVVLPVNQFLTREELVHIAKVVKTAVSLK